MITFILKYNTNTVKILHSLQKQYPDLAVIVGINVKDKDVQKTDFITQIKNPNIKLVSLSQEISPWLELLNDVNTPFVFVGQRITELPIGWGNFERSIRLINGKNIYKPKYSRIPK